jgi:hypothetical protein
MTKSFTRFATGSLAAAALAFSLSLPSPANAQSRGARAAGQRLQNAQHREVNQIRQGVRNGSLTKAQAENLKDHMGKMRSAIAADRASGKLTPQDLRQIKNGTKKEEKAIKGAEDSNKGTMPPTQQ